MIGRAVLVLALCLASGCASSVAAPVATARTCAHCDLALGTGAVVWKGRRYHPPCYDAVAPRCGICARALKGEYVTLADRLDYHADCFERAVRCDCCLLPLEGPSRLLRDGRVSCHACAAAAPTSPAEALAAARAALARFGLLVPQEVPVPVELCGRGDLAARAGTLASPDLRALTEVIETPALADGTRGERRYRIYALHGLPRSVLVGVLAHELVHVLQSEVGGNADREPALCEGAAVWVQTRVLRMLGDELQADLLLRSRDPSYGGGARRFAQLVEARGQSRALEMGLTGRRFPEGF